MDKITSKSKKSLLPIAAIGAGFLSGLLGAGGGIILYFALGYLYKKDAKENLVTSSVSVMLFCVISLFFYKGSSALDAQNLLRLAIPAALGGITGALLLSKIPTKTVKKLFSVIVILSGLIMLLR